MTNAIEALAWTGLTVQLIVNVLSLLKGAVDISKSHGTFGLFLYILIITWFVWSCVHLLRVA
jgi:hypothetical protein